MEHISQTDLEYEDDGRLTYNGKLFTGVTNDFWANGKLASEVNFLNGLLEGEAKKWYENGVLREEEFYVEGRVRKIKNWDENGHLRLMGEYEFDIPLWEKKWDERGDLSEDFILTEENPRYETLQMLRKIKAESQDD